MGLTENTVVKGLVDDLRNRVKWRANEIVGLERIGLEGPTIDAHRVRIKAERRVIETLELLMQEMDEGEACETLPRTDVAHGTWR